MTSCFSLLIRQEYRRHHRHCLSNYLIRHCPNQIDLSCRCRHSVQTNRIIHRYRRLSPKHPKYRHCHGRIGKKTMRPLPHPHQECYRCRRRHQHYHLDRHYRGHGLPKNHFHKSLFNCQFHHCQCPNQIYRRFRHCHGRKCLSNRFHHGLLHHH